MAKQRSADVILKTIEVPRDLAEKIDQARGGKKFSVYVLEAAAFRAGAEYVPRRLGRPPKEQPEKI